MNNRLKILPLLVTLIFLASCAKNDTPESVTLRLGVGGVGGQVWGEKEQTVLYGESSKPVSEVADKGFVFDGWYSNGVKTSDAPVLAMDEMKENTEITARFRQEHTDIPLIVIDTENGNTVARAGTISPAASLCPTRITTKTAGTILLRFAEEETRRGTFRKKATR